MILSDIIAARDLETLRTAVTGGIFALGDAGYDQAWRAWS